MILPTRLQNHIQNSEQELGKLRRQIYASVDKTQLAKINRGHAEEIDDIRKSAEREIAHVKSMAESSVQDAQDRLEKMRASNRDLLSKVARLESFLDPKNTSSHPFLLFCFQVF